MTSRWIWITALTTTLGLGACEKRKAPAAEAPAEPAPAENTVAPAEPPAEAEAAPAPAHPVDAAAAMPDQAEPSKPAEPSKAEPNKPDEPSTDEPSKGDEQAADSAGGKQGKCGGIGGFRCTGKKKCRYAKSAFAPPHPDAMGACVAENYCDAPPDCEGLMHIMTVGKWACARNRCAWKAEGGSSAPQ